MEVAHAQGGNRPEKQRFGQIVAAALRTAYALRHRPPRHRGCKPASPHDRARLAWAAAVLKEICEGLEKRSGR
jgi:hypothetical protein